MFYDSKYAGLMLDKTKKRRGFVQAAVLGGDLRGKPSAGTALGSGYR
ncbi:MAG: hypothetical protein IT314_17720 [Anaerolineales bacterium]|nr:hypothetical protein [Anaerolineales bacterium]